MKLLFITQELDAGSDVLGITPLWIDALASRVEHVNVLALSVGALSPAANVTLHSMGKERAAGRARRVLRFWWVMLQLCLRREIDLVFVHMVPLYAVLAVPVARLFGVPVVLWYTRAAITTQLRVAHALVHRCVTASAESFPLPSGKLTVTGHGIDMERFAPRVRSGQTGAPVVLRVDRISRVKDQETLIRAVAALRQRAPDLPFRVRVVGGPFYDADRAYERDLRTLAGHLGVEDAIDFAGPRPNAAVAEEYAASSVVAHTSRTGSIDRVVVEAMASARPVVTCNPAFVPLLGELAPGLMYPAGDAVALAERLEALLKAPADERSRLGKQLREIASREHSLEGWADRTVAVFRDVLSLGKLRKDGARD